MMRNILLILVLCFSTTAMAETKSYPDRWESFQTIDDMQDVYWKIYVDTNNEDEQEILERMKWHESDFTEAELDTFRKLNAPEVSVEKKYKLSDQLKTSDALESYYLYEKELLRLENDIDLRNWIETIFVNDTLSDSPFDLIDDLNIIEKDIFGQKFTEQQWEPPLFLSYDAEQKLLRPETEDWQDGREETLQSMLKSRKYKGRDNSLSGILAGLKQSSKKLLSYSLISGKATEQFMESGTNNQTSGDAYGAGVSDYAPSAPDNTDPESETVLLETPWDQQAGMANAKLTNMSDLDRNKNTNMGQLISNVIASAIEKDQGAEEVLQGQLMDWERGMEMTENEKSKVIIGSRLRFWNQDLEATLEGFISLRRIFEDFLKEKSAL